MSLSRSHTRFVCVVFQERESSVFLLLVIGGCIDDDVDESRRDFAKFVEDLISSFAFGDVAHEEALIGHADVHFQNLSLLHLMIVVPVVVKGSICTLRISKHHRKLGQTDR